MSKTKLTNFLLLFAVAMLIVSPSFVLAVAYPEPPSDELKEKWRQMGEENERIYGSGTVTNQTTVKAEPTPISTPRPEPSIVLTSTPTATPTPVSDELEGASESVTIDLTDWKPQLKWYHRVWRWFRMSFLYR